MRYVIIILAILACLFLPIRWSIAEAPEAPKLPPIREYAEKRVNEVFGSGWLSFEAIIALESRWDPAAQNPHSSAYGLCQFLNSTWKNGKTSNPYEQIDECIVYISERYGNPQIALKFHKAHNWY